MLLDCIGNKMKIEKKNMLNEKSLREPRFMSYNLMKYIFILEILFNY